MKLPDYLGKMTKKRIKNMCLVKLIRHVYKEISEAKDKCENAIKDTFGENDLLQAIQQSSLYEQAFQRSSRLHKERLSKKIKHLEKKRSIPNDPSDPAIDRYFNLVTDLSNTMSDTDKKLLAKGPKFALTKAWNENTKLEIKSNFCKMAYQLRWRSQMSDSLSQNRGIDQAFPRYPESQNVAPPIQRDPILEDKLRLSFAKLKEVMDDIDRMKPITNLNLEEKKTLKNLKKMDLTFLPSDKGGEFCVLDTKQYNEIAYKHLADEITYKRVPRMSSKTIEMKINNTWRKVAREIGMPTRVIKNFTTNNSDLPQFYHLIKTHKKDREIKCRPIVSNARGPSKKMSWLLCRILKPVLDYIPSHITSSSQLMNCLKTMEPTKITTCHYPISLDVCALYTSIPPEDAIQAMRKKLEQHLEKQLPLRVNHICDILTTILQNSFFEFKGDIFLQKIGLPIGNSISGILSTVYMDCIESQILHLPTIALYKRYVDDAVLITTGEEEAKALFKMFNELDPNISFEMELPERGELSLLDFTLRYVPCSSDHTCPSFSFSFYRKRAKKDVFINATSAMPTSVKLDCIRNEVQRIQRRCSNFTDEGENVRAFQDILRKNDYPEKIVQQVTEGRRKKWRKKRSETVKDPVYLKFPFLTDSLFRRVQRIFSKADLPVKVFDRNYTLRNALSKEKHNGRCTLKNCTINSTLCLLKMCVYRVKCLKCNDIYIGSTCRYLHTRINEHLTSKTSSVFLHKLACKGDLEISRLAMATDVTSLRLKEAILIRKFMPAMNTKHESEELLSLIFE